MVNAESIVLAHFVERLQEAVDNGRVTVDTLARVFCTKEARVRDWLNCQDLPELFMVEPILDFIDGLAA